MSEVQETRTVNPAQQIFGRLLTKERQFAYWKQTEQIRIDVPNAMTKALLICSRTNLFKAR